MSLSLELRKKITAAMNEAKKKGRQLIVCVLDDSAEDLQVLSSYDNATTHTTMAALQAITECYLSDTEEQDGNQEARPRLIH